MKKILLITVLFFMISCKSQNSKVSDDTCKVTEIENFEEFDKIHRNIDTTSIYKKEIDEFEKIDTGILLCKFISNNKFGNFTVIKEAINKLVCINSNSSSKKEVALKSSDSDLISKTIYSISKKCYYEQCDKYVSNDNYYLMLIKVKGKIVAKYFSHGNLSFKKVDGNENLNNVKSVLEIMYRNSFNKEYTN